MSARQIVTPVVLAGCLLLLAVAMVRYHITHEWTSYAAGFSNSGWKQVTNGMPVVEVRKRLGSAFADPGDNGRLIYTRGNALFFRSCELQVSGGVVIQKQDSITSD